MTEGRDHWWHRLLDKESSGLPARSDGVGRPALHPLYLRAPPAQPKGIVHTTGGYLTQVDRHHQVCLRPAGGGYLLVHRRHRVGHGALLCRVWPPGQRRHHPDVRGRARLAGARSVLEDGRAARRDRPLHRPDGHPRLHEVGPRASGRARPLDPSAARHASANRSTRRRGCGTIEHIGRRTLPNRGYLVADRNRRDHDYPASRRHHHEAWVGHHALSRYLASSW